MKNLNLFYICCVFLHETSLANAQRLKFVTIRERPFTFDDENGNKVGYLMDLLKLLEDRIGFSSYVYYVADGKYGIKQPDGSFNGMIWDLMNGKAHVGLAHFTLTVERSNVVDFSRTYDRSSYAILFKKPKPGNPIPFTSLRDIVESNTTLLLAPVRDTSTHHLLLRSKFWVHQELADRIKQRGLSQLPYDRSDAIRMVKNDEIIHLGNDAHLFEWASRDNELMVWRLRPEMQEKPKVLAFQPGSKYVDIFNSHLLDLFEDGNLTVLENKWRPRMMMGAERFHYC